MIPNSHSGSSGTTNNVGTSNYSTGAVTTAPTLKATFTYKAYKKLIFLRDLKDCEVAVLGETSKDNPLHVLDIHLIKQKVSTVAADMDEEDVSRHVEEMMARGIHPINSERFWIHTHPMTGEGSANPSGKDMATWNDPNNSEKNFQVMFILSKSGHVTCKVRVRTDSKIAGFNKIVHEESASFEIMESEDDKAHCKARLIDVFGEKAYDKLGPKILLENIKIKELYPEFEELEKTYAQLVTNSTYSYSGQTNKSYGDDDYGDYYKQYSKGYNYTPGGGNHQKSLGFHGNAKKRATVASVPEMLYLFDPNAVDFDKADFDNTKNLRNEYDVTVYQLAGLLKEWEKSREAASWKTFMKGFINTGAVLSKHQCVVLNSSDHYKLKFLSWSQMLWPEVVAFCGAYNGGSDE